VTYTLSIWYAATPDDARPQTHELTPEEVQNYLRPEVGFLHDMLALEGRGVRKLMLEVRAPSRVGRLPGVDLRQPDGAA
jgi:hypothetical protein